MIEVEDRTKPKTLEELTSYVEELAKSTGEMLKALSKNDSIVLEQVKEALQEITKKIVMLDSKVNLLSDVFENVLISAEKNPAEKLTWDEYRELVLKLKG